MSDDNVVDSCPEDGLLSDELQLALLKKWFPWLGGDEDQNGADTIDTLVQWFETVGGSSVYPSTLDTFDDNFEEDDCESTDTYEGGC